MVQSELVKTDFTDIRKARITLQCELKPGYYIYNSSGQYPNLNSIAEALYDLDFEYLSPNGESITTLGVTTPVGYRGFNRKIPHWLVVKITEPADRHTSSEWQDFLAKATAKILRKLAPEGEDNIASIEYDEMKRFVVMTDLGGHNESDFIEV